MPKDYQALYDADLALIADAKANGFMDAKAIRDGLGWDKPGPNGSYYDSIGVADRWVREAGEEFVILIPDGEMYMLGDPPKRVTIPKAERIGVYPDVFERVLAAKNAYYAALDARDAQSWADAEEAKAEHERRKAENAAQLERERIERDEQRRQSDSERDARLYVKRYNEFIGYGLEPDYITAAIGEPPEGVDVEILKRSLTPGEDQLSRTGKPTEVRRYRGHAGVHRPDE